MTEQLRLQHGHLSDSHVKLAILGAREFELSDTFLTPSRLDVVGSLQPLPARNTRGPSTNRASPHC
jgi:hypothetical protein